MKSLSKLTEKIVAKSLTKLGVIKTHIFINWMSIAGQYKYITFPEKITFNKRNNNDGVIYLKVENGFGPEVQLAIPFILNQINAQFGYQVISKIKIKQTNLNLSQERLTTDILKEEQIDTQDLISNILPEGEIKLAMQKFEIARKNIK